MGGIDYHGIPKSKMFFLVKENAHILQFDNCFYLKLSCSSIESSNFQRMRATPFTMLPTALKIGCKLWFNGKGSGKILVSI